LRRRLRVSFKYKQRGIAFFFLTECLIRALFLDVATTVTQKMAELCTEYPVLTIIAGLGEKKKLIDFAIFRCLCSFRGRMKP